MGKLKESCSPVRREARKTESVQSVVWITVKMTVCIKVC